MHHPSPGPVREQLDRILADKRFSASPHLSRFLRFAVGETLEGRTGGLKESILGVEVFGRGPNFDPRLDPIVRVQGAKLRARLKQYYEQEGSGDRVVIEVPRGGYVPAFRLRGEEKPVPAVAPRSRANLFRWVMGAAVGAVLAVVILWLVQRIPGPPRLRIRQLTFDTGSTTFPAISRDGRLLAFASDRSGKGDLDIWVQEIVGGEPVQATKHEAADISPDFSPDGNRIVFRSHRDGGGIYSVSAIGTGERKLAGEGWRPRFSPDGNFIAYQANSSRPGGDLYIIPSGGGQPRLVSIGGDIVRPWTPLWTPDGKHILFTGAKGEERDLWIVAAGGGTPVQVGLRAVLAREGVTWSASIEPGGWNGNRLVFAAPRENAHNLWEIDFSPVTWMIAGSPKQITFGSAMETFPRVSGTGQIVFSSEIRRTNLWELPTRPAGGTLSGVQIQLTHDASLPPGAPLYVPRFSATRSVLAYTSERSGNRDIWLKNLNDGSEATLASNPWLEDHARLSHDGSRVAYWSRTGSRTAIHVVEIASRTQRDVCTDCGLPEDWTKDDCGIFYISGGQHSIYLIDVATGLRTEMVRNQRLQFLQVSVSPDGRWLSATANGAGSFLIRLKNGKVDDRGAWKVTSKDGSVESMHWSPDGKLLYFFSMRDDFRCLMAQRIDSATGEPASEAFAVQHFHDSRRSPWSTWIAVDPTGLIVRLTEPTSNIFLASRGG